MVADRNDDKGECDVSLSNVKFAQGAPAEKSNPVIAMASMVSQRMGVAVLVAPHSEFVHFRPTYEEMLKSVQFPASERSTG